jgi:hypothetical protein
MVLPNFYILGAQKCGTSWLTSMLSQHPEIFISRRKELHYFNRTENYERGREWYERHFRDCGSAIAIGEATPNYLAVTSTGESAKIIERILALTPDARFIVSLRNPVTRAVSALLHHIREGRLSPWVNLDAEFDLIFSRRHSYPDVLEFGCYNKQIRSFLRHFPVDRFAFIIYEHDILDNKHRTLRRVCQFLGVRTDFEFRRIDVLRNPTMRTRMGLVLSQLPPRKIGKRLGWWAERLGLGKELSISNNTLQRLYQYYESDRAELSVLIVQDLDIWQEGVKFIVT